MLQDWNLTLAVINYWLKWLSSFNKGTPQEETDIHEEVPHPQMLTHIAKLLTVP